MVHWEQNPAGEISALLHRRGRQALVDCAIREGADPRHAEDIVQTTFLDAYRAALSGEAPGDQPEPIENPNGPGIARLVERVRRLPRDQCDVLLLREIGGHSYAEIGLRLGLRATAVPLLLFRARRLLRRRPAEQRNGFGALMPFPWRQLGRPLLAHPGGVAFAPTTVAFKGALIGTAIATTWIATPAHHGPITSSGPASPSALVTHLAAPVAHATVLERPRLAKTFVVTGRPTALTVRPSQPAVKASTSRQIAKTAPRPRQVGAPVRRPSAPAGTQPQRDPELPAHAVTTTTAREHIATPHRPPTSVSRPSAPPVEVLPQITTVLRPSLPAAIATLASSPVDAVSTVPTASVESDAAQSVAVSVSVAAPVVDEAVSVETAAASQLASVPALPPSLP